MTCWSKTTAQLKRERWESGRREHRTNGGGFVGDPLREALEEAVDGLNYCDELQARGAERWTVQQMREGFAQAITAARTLHDLQCEDDLAGRFVARLTE